MNLVEDLCPYCNEKADVCAASVAALKIDLLVKLNRCNEGNYEGCPLYQAQSLKKQYRYAS